MPTYRMKKKVGPHKFNGEWIKPGDTVTCDASEIEQVMEKFEEVRKKPEQSEPESQTKEKDESPIAPEEKDDFPVRLKVEHKGGGKYNVVNTATNEPINDDYLTKQQAHDLVDSAEAERAGNDED